MQMCHEDGLTQAQFVEKIIKDEVQRLHVTMVHS